MINPFSNLPLTPLSFEHEEQDEPQGSPLAVTLIVDGQTVSVGNKIFQAIQEDSKKLSDPTLLTLTNISLIHFKTLINSYVNFELPVITKTNLFDFWQLSLRLDHFNLRSHCKQFVLEQLDFDEILNLKKQAMTLNSNDLVPTFDQRIRNEIKKGMSQGLDSFESILKYFDEFTKEELILDNCEFPITPNMMEFLNENRPDLKKLSFANCTFQTGFYSLPPDLEELCLSGCNGLEKLQGLQEHSSLTKLDISACELSEEAMQAIGTCSEMKNINFTFATLPDSGLTEIADLNLRELYLSQTKNLSGDSMDIIRKFQQLTRLDLSGGSELDINQLENFIHLKFLNVSNCEISSEIVEELVKVISLEELALSDNILITVDDLKLIKDNLKHLQKLNVTFCRNAGCKDFEFGDVCDQMRTHGMTVFGPTSKNNNHSPFYISEHEFARQVQSINSQLNNPSNT